MRMRTRVIKDEEYIDLKRKAQINDSLLTQLVSGLEDIRSGRVKPWKRITTRSSS